VLYEYLKKWKGDFFVFGVFVLISGFEELKLSDSIVGFCMLQVFSDSAVVALLSVDEPLSMSMATVTPP
jgi:hypothetical protein